MAEGSEAGQMRLLCYDDGPQPVSTRNDLQGHFLDRTAPEIVLDRTAPEVVPNEYSDEYRVSRTIYEPSEKEVANNPLEHTVKAINNQSTIPRHRKWRMVFLGIGVVFAAIAIAVGIAISQTQKTKKEQSVTSSPGSPSVSNNATNQTIENLPPNYFSTIGAFNGSGIAIADPLSTSGNLLLFFQHHTGDLRLSQLIDNAWQGGNSDDSLGVTNIRNATPLAATSYHEASTSGNTTKWMAFYVDESFILQNVIRDNITSTWTNGNLGGFNFRGSTDSNSALAVCFEANWYGPVVGKSPGLRLFAGGEDDLIHEYTWALGSTPWETGFTFPKSNGYAGVTCWPDGGITDVYLQNSDNNLEVWWKDFNTQITNTSTHPLGVWTRGPSAATELRQNSSIAFNNNVYFQTDSGNILAINLSSGTGNAENIAWGNSFSIDDVRAKPGTAIGCQTFYPSDTGPSGLYVFFQDNGTDVAAYTRGQVDGTWSMEYIPVD